MSDPVPARELPHARAARMDDVRAVMDAVGLEDSRRSRRSLRAGRCSVLFAASHPGADPSAGAVRQLSANHQRRGVSLGVRTRAGRARSCRPVAEQPWTERPRSPASMPCARRCSRRGSGSSLASSASGASPGAMIALVLHVGRDRRTRRFARRSTVPRPSITAPTPATASRPIEGAPVHRPAQISGRAARRAHRDDHPAGHGGHATRSWTRSRSSSPAGRRYEPGADRVLATVHVHRHRRLDAQRAADDGRPPRGASCSSATTAVMRQHLNRVSAVTEVKTTGDGFLATFDGPARAIQVRPGTPARRPQALGLLVRVGLHAGECERRHG